MYMYSSHGWICGQFAVDDAINWPVQTHTLNLPFEMQEVMMRLDAKSAARSRCVSRSWKNYIEDMSSRNFFIIWKGLPLLLIWLD